MTRTRKPRGRLNRAARDRGDGRTGLGVCALLVLFTAALLAIFGKLFLPGTGKLGEVAASAKARQLPAFSAVSCFAWAAAVDNSTLGSSNSVNFAPCLNFLRTVYGAAIPASPGRSARGRDWIRQRLRAEAGRLRPAGDQAEGLPLSAEQQEDLSRTADWVYALVTLVGTKRSASRLRGADQFSPLKVVVVGAGPVGLSTALHAWVSGHDVQVVEKRSAFQRTFWFDLYPSPWYTSVGFLDALGFASQRIEATRHEESAITVRASDLERFLWKCGALVGIPVSFGSEFLATCETAQGDQVAPSGDAVVLTRGSKTLDELQQISDALLSRTPTVNWDWCAGIRLSASKLGSFGFSSLTKVPFDVLVGADGTKSRVRAAAAVQTHIHSQVLVDVRKDTGSDAEASLTPSETRKIKFSVPKLQHVALVADFKSPCPKPRSRKPWQFDLEAPGVSTVYKRFYFSHCQLQVFFKHSHGQQVLKTYRQESHARRTAFSGSRTPSIQASAAKAARSKRSLFWVPPRPLNYSAVNASASSLLWQRKALPWDTMLAIMQSAVEEPLVSSVDGLLDLLVVADGELSAWVFPVQLRVAEKHTWQLSPNNTAVVALLGDSSYSAHFRLGVGVNSGILASFYLDQLLFDLERLTRSVRRRKAALGARDSILANVRRAVASRQADDWDRVQSFVNFQASAIFYEAFCNWVVLFNSKPLLKSQAVFERMPPDDIRKNGEVDDSVKALPWPLSEEEVLRACQGIAVA